MQKEKGVNKNISCSPSGPAGGAVTPAANDRCIKIEEDDSCGKTEAGILVGNFRLYEEKGKFTNMYLLNS